MCVARQLFLGPTQVGAAPQGGIKPARWTKRDDLRFTQAGQAMKEAAIRNGCTVSAYLYRPAARPESTAIDLKNERTKVLIWGGGHVEPPRAGAGGQRNRLRGLIGHTRI
jgi:hypothetical protein